jgi:hypothetical protein
VFRDDCRAVFRLSELSPSPLRWTCGPQTRSKSRCWTTIPENRITPIVPATHQPCTMQPHGFRRHGQEAATIEAHAEARAGEGAAVESEEHAEQVELRTEQNWCVR